MWSIIPWSLTLQFPHSLNRNSRSSSVSECSIDTGTRGQEGLRKSNGGERIREMRKSPKVEGNEEDAGGGGPALRLLLLLLQGDSLLSGGQHLVEGVHADSRFDAVDPLVLLLGRGS